MKRNMGFYSGCWISVMSALLALLLIPLEARANTVLGNMSEPANPLNSTSVAEEHDKAKLDGREMSKPLSNMFLILRSGRKPRDGGELGSGLQEDDDTLTSTPSPEEVTTEDVKISLDSAETDHLLPGVIKKDLLPSESTKIQWQGTEETMESTVFDLDGNQESDPDPQETPTPVTTLPSHTESFTVDFLDPRSRVNDFIHPSPTAHELQGREPTSWAIPNSHDYLTPHDQTPDSPSSEEDTTKPDDYDDDLPTSPPPPPPRNFHPHFPNPFVPAREKELPTNRDKVGKSSSAECRLGSVLVNGTCKSQCEMTPNYCFNGGQCFVLEGTGVFCRCNIQDYVWHKGARCEAVITEFQVMCIAIGASALTVLLLFMIVVCFAKKLHVLKTENNKLRKRSSSKYRPSSEQHNDNFSLSTIAEGSNPNVRKLCDSPPHARALAYYDNIICQDDPNSQNKMEDAVKSPPPKEDESLNIQNSLTPKHENHKVLGEENSSEVNSLQNNMM
ncbi:chondroitin sulfate proteoglycan 5 isoform X3 [Silurus meridionalis]|uniref:chondroitin sulfate proteoglycan 5 isoform X3 n=1 Tax=Silurus meridionalis TaxID=175797 RepID=UPI001EEADFE6|nr:chondroitin sulfate proteoglycan 5 isoform X3 [Silurus meridionalis]